MPKITETPPVLLPYLSHGVDFVRENLSNQAIADCPFCGRENKFYVSEEDGKFKCFDCNEHGNSITFLRQIHQLGTRSEDGLMNLAESRKLLSPQTLEAWEVTVPLTAIGQTWAVPAFSAVSRDIVQLYRYLPDPVTKKKRLIATTGLNHGIFGVNLFDDSKPDVYICEGPWDAMALWEALGISKKEPDGTLSQTETDSLSLLASANVLAVPGCKVFNDSWSALLAGKRVFLLYDNDHPREVKLKNGTKHTLQPDGLEGMKLAADVMSRAETTPVEVNYLQWGEEGYDPTLKHGTDIRDVLTSSTFPSERVKALEGLLSKLKPIPSDWLGGKTFKGDGSVHLEIMECTNWRDLEMAWRHAAKWTPGLRKALSCMLAACVSTGHVGDQLWLKVLSPPSSGKTMLCEALSVSKKYTYPKSTVRGFHSGYKSDKEGSKDHSLIPLLRGKTLITKDGDTLLSSPARDQILSQGRDLYDRVSRAHYNNGLDRDYEDVSITWLLCGTAGLRSLDSSELGERFLTCSIMDDIDPELERSVAQRSLSHIRENLGTMVNGTADSKDTPKKIEAKRKTGGYLEYLRNNARNLYKKVEFSDEAEKVCLDLGEFVAYMRARPSKKQEELAEREFSTRLSNQLGILAASLAVVLNRKSVDEEVLKIVRSVALDTARGRTLEIVSQLYRVGERGALIGSIAIWTGQDEEKEKLLLTFLKRIKAVELHQEEIAPGVPGQPRWRLTSRLMELYSICVPTI
jgi:hypothetical protein